MKIPLRGGEFRAGILLAAAIAIYLTASYFVLPAWDRLQQQSSTVQDKEDQLKRFRRALQAKDHYAQLLDQARKSIAGGEGRLINGDNASLATVELQTLVEDAAKKLNLNLGPRSVTAPKRKDNYFNEITMSLSFDGTPNQMVSMLGELRNAPKFVTVRSLQVTPLSNVQEAPPKGDVKKTIRVNLTVVGLLSIPPTAVVAKKG
jgi:hypothetical protein